MTRSPDTRPQFRYSVYWGTWSLLLSERCKVRPGCGQFVEIDLVPINGWQCGDSEYIAKVRAVNVRRHSTSRMAGRREDRLEHELPAEVLSDARWQFGPHIFDWLVNPRTEILGIIDWAKLEANSNGGCRLGDCVKDEFRHLLPPSLLPEPQLLAA